MMETTKRTPREIRRAANLSIVTMAVIMFSAILIAIREPKVITNREVVVLPNDSVTAMQEKIMRLEGQLATMTTVAETRALFIHKLTDPVQLLTDSLLRLSRIAVSETRDIRKELAAYQAAQDNRQATLLSKMDERKAPVVIMPEGEVERIEVQKIHYDTIYATLPEERKSFWRRLKELWRPKR